MDVENQSGRNLPDAILEVIGIVETIKETVVATLKIIDENGEVAKADSQADHNVGGGTPEIREVKLDKNEYSQFSFLDE
jgi:hypothetical protein